MTSRSVHLVVALGQSNMSGRGQPVYRKAARTHPALWQFPRTGRHAGTLVLATEPLAMPDEPKGMGPALEFSRRLLRASQAGSSVVIVPAAVGGTALCTDVARGWRWGVRGNLADLAVNQTRSAIEAAQKHFPEATIHVAAILWLQGESDALDEVGGETYRSALEQLINGLRSALGSPTTPFIVGQMAVEGQDIGTHTEIDHAQAVVAGSLPGVGFARAPLRSHKGDRVHFTARGQRAIARRMFREFRRLQPYTSVDDSARSRDPTAKTAATRDGISQRPMTGPR